MKKARTLTTILATGALVFGGASSALASQYDTPQQPRSQQSCGHLGTSCDDLAAAEREDAKAAKAAKASRARSACAKRHGSARTKRRCKAARQSRSAPRAHVALGNTRS